MIMTTVGKIPTAKENRNVVETIVKDNAQKLQLRLILIVSGFVS